MNRINFLLSLRQIWKNKSIAFINIGGLTLGILAYVFIMEYVGFEINYNKTFPKYQSIYRMIESGEESSSYLPPGLGPLFADEFSNIQSFTRVIASVGDGVIKVLGQEEPKVFRIENSAYVDQTFLDYFNSNILIGQPNLSAPQTTILSRKLAKKLFDEQNPIGQTIQLNNNFGPTNFEVTGIMEDFPPNTDVKFDILLSIQALMTDEGRNGNDWADPNGIENSFTRVFFELKSPDDKADLVNDINAFVEKSIPEDKLTFDLQPVSEMHLGNDLYDPYPTYGSQLFVLFLFIVGNLILLIAWVNYINLYTAQALEKGKEVSIRKVIGASKAHLVWQAVAETVLLTGIAILLALGLVPILQSKFNLLINQPLDYKTFVNSIFIWPAVVGPIICAILAGLYVGFGLNKFQPVEKLKGHLSKSKKGLWIRKSLVVLQFTIAIVFIASTLILIRQLQFLYHQNIGIQLEQRIAIEGPNIMPKDFQKNVQAFREKLGQLSFVKQFSGSGLLPGKGYNLGDSGFTTEPPQPGQEEIQYFFLFIDEFYLETFGIDMLAGRNFLPEETVEQWKYKKVICNEKAIESLGINNLEEAIGTTVVWNDENWEIVGVYENYNHQSLRSAIQPMVFLPSQNSGYYTVVMDMDNFQDKINQIASIYGQFFPDNPFNYEFMDEAFASLYESEQQLSRLFAGAAFLAIFISMLGLFGLITFVIKNKRKEIGIRKILGASIGNLIRILSFDFIQLIFIGFLLATPITYYLMNQWLQSFAYQTNLSWWIFAVAGLITIVIAMVTVGVQSFKISNRNPVEALRNE